MAIFNRDARTVEQHPFAFFRSVHERQSTWLTTDAYRQLAAIGGVSVRGAGVHHDLAYSVITTNETARIKPIQDFNVDALTEGMWQAVQSLRSARRNVKVAGIETLDGPRFRRKVVLRLDDSVLNTERDDVLDFLADESGSSISEVVAKLRPNPTPHITMAILSGLVSKYNHQRVVDCVESIAPTTVNLEQATLYRANE